MGIIVKPSDLKYRYPRDVANREKPKFRGKPDPTVFNRNDLYEILPMMAAVMEALGSNDQRVLNMVEDILNDETPAFIRSREDLFDYLTGMARERLGP